MRRRRQRLCSSIFLQEASGWMRSNQRAGRPAVRSLGQTDGQTTRRTDERTNGQMEDGGRAADRQTSGRATARGPTGQSAPPNIRPLLCFGRAPRPSAFLARASQSQSQSQPQPHTIKVAARPQWAEPSRAERRANTNRGPIGRLELTKPSKQRQDCQVSIDMWRASA